LPGGVPDADDTAGALLALRSLGIVDERVREAAWAGIEWLLNLQNRDGGVPTFCRGWGKLPFDQSSADLTAHAMRAWAAWLTELPSGNQQRVRKAMVRAVQYLKSHQEQTGELAGGWKPLWFGNQHRQDEINWTYGTSRVLLALAENADQGGLEKEAEAAAHFLTRVQLAEGGWGGGNGGVESSVEETALAVEALAGWLEHCGSGVSKDRAHSVESAVAKGVCWLLDRVEEGAWKRPAPIGFYFAKLWYYERLYPQIFTVGALGRAARVLKN
jgi:squalene-hopene/tetraprenyl-beta-curcumene cyclase